MWTAHYKALLPRLTVTQHPHHDSAAASRFGSLLRLNGKHSAATCSGEMELPVSYRIVTERKLLLSTTVAPLEGSTFCQIPSSAVLEISPL